MAKINDSTLREEIFQKYNFRVLNPRCNAASRFTDYMESVFKAYAKLEQWQDITRHESAYDKLDYLTRVLVRIERLDPDRLAKMRQTGQTVAQLPYSKVIPMMTDKVTVLDAMVVTLEWQRFREDGRAHANQVKEQSRAREADLQEMERRLKRGNARLDLLREKIIEYQNLAKSWESNARMVLEDISRVRQQILADEIELKILRSESGLNQG